jgi:protein tyrosine phosphatase (PTP) superfamily phosphohydrolase (DUF442 family)
MVSKTEMQRKLAMKWILLFTVLSILTGGCAHHGTKVKTNINVTKILMGHNYGNIYFSAQPKERDLLELKKKGFAAVINMRGKEEGKYLESWERGIVKKQGIAYYNIPFSMKSKLTNDYISTLTSKILDHRKEGKVLVHCSSGNRVAVWIGGHFLKDHEYSKDDAMKIAKQLGLTNAKAEKILQSYLDQK